MALILGTSAAATVSGSSARTLMNLRATGEASFSNRSVSTMPGDRLCTPMLCSPARTAAQESENTRAHARPCTLLHREAVALPVAHADHCKEKWRSEELYSVQDRKVHYVFKA